MEKKFIKINSKKNTWEAAIKAGVQILVENNCAKNELATKIIESTSKYGPYYIIMPHVALAHAEVGDYNLKVGLSLIKFENPVSFSNALHHSVQLLFTLSAIDSTSHMKMLQKFANLFTSNSDLVSEIMHCCSIEEISKKLKGL